MPTTLPLEVASGILIAAFIIFAVRYVVALARRGQVLVAAALSIPLALVGGGLIAAGIGIVPF